jgi:hypothetical protein
MGVGYTTSEAEDAINHPVRRKIILWLMTFGNAGIITGISSLVLGFIDAEVDESALRATTLALGLLALVLLTRWRWLARPFDRFTRWALARWTSLDTRDLAGMLRFGHDFGIVEIYAHSGDWMAGRSGDQAHMLGVQDQAQLLEEIHAIDEDA